MSKQIPVLASFAAVISYFASTAAHFRSRWLTRNITSPTLIILQHFRQIISLDVRNQNDFILAGGLLELLRMRNITFFFPRKEAGFRESVATNVCILYKPQNDKKCCFGYHQVFNRKRTRITTWTFTPLCSVATNISYIFSGYFLSFYICGRRAIHQNILHNDNKSIGSHCHLYLLVKLTGIVSTSYPA